VPAPKARKATAVAVHEEPDESEAFIGYGSEDSLSDREKNLPHRAFLKEIEVAKSANRVKTTVKTMFVCDSTWEWDFLIDLLQCTTHIVIIFLEVKEQHCSEPWCKPAQYLDYLSAFCTQFAVAEQGGPRSLPQREHPFPKSQCALLNKINDDWLVHELTSGAYGMFRRWMVKDVTFVPRNYFNEEDSLNFCVLEVTLQNHAVAKAGNEKITEKVRMGIFCAAGYATAADWSGPCIRSYDGTGEDDVPLKNFSSAVADEIMISGIRLMFGYFGYHMYTCLPKLLERANAQHGAAGILLMPMFMMPPNKDVGRDEYAPTGFPMAGFVFGPHGMIKIPSSNEAPDMEAVKWIKPRRVGRPDGILPSEWCMRDFDPRPAMKEGSNPWEDVEAKLEATWPEFAQAIEFPQDREEAGQEEDAFFFLEAWGGTPRKPQWRFEETAIACRVMPWLSSEWSRIPWKHAWPQAAIDRGIPQKLAKSKLGMIKIKTPLTPWRATDKEPPEMIQVGVARSSYRGDYPYALDTPGQKDAWGKLVPGIVSAVFFIGTSLPGQTSKAWAMHRNRQKKEEGSAVADKSYPGQKAANWVPKKRQMEGMQVGWRGAKRARNTK